jgi:hypothetical protein
MSKYRVKTDSAQCYIERGLKTLVTELEAMRHPVTINIYYSNGEMIISANASDFMAMPFASDCETLVSRFRIQHTAASKRKKRS